MSKTKRKKRRTGRRNLAPWAVAIAALGIMLWLLLANVVFVVREVQVAGAGEISANDVLRLSGIRMGSRFSALDEQRVRQNVESDGRLAFVDLETRLPGRVVLTVRPRTMDALILEGSRVLVLDSDAYVVRIVDSLPDATIPYVTGIRVYSPRLGYQLNTADGRCGAMKAVLEAMKAQHATLYASELNVSDIADLRIITRTGMTVLLGSTEDIDAKIAWMAGALADLEARGETTGQLDVSSGTKADYAPPAKAVIPDEELNQELQSELTEGAPDESQQAPPAS